MTPISADQLRALLHQKVEALGSVRTAARILGVSETAIRAVIFSGADPGDKLARAMGYKRAVQFELLRKRESA
jgi:hypothetical protein